MIHEAFRPEFTFGVQRLMTLAPAILGFITLRQREWLNKVWHYQCQGRNIGMVHKCNQGKGVQYHHIVPQGYSYEYLGHEEDNVDRPTNLIPLCSVAHVGTDGFEDCIHPDQRKTQIEFQHGDRNAFKKLQEERMLKAQSGIPYWNSKYDFRMANVVKFKVERYIRNNKTDSYPPHNHNGNHK